jgi:hypothetical protein
MRVDDLDLEIKKTIKDQITLDEFRQRITIANLMSNADDLEKECNSPFVGITNVTHLAMLAYYKMQLSRIWNLESRKFSSTFSRYKKSRFSAFTFRSLRSVQKRAFEPILPNFVGIQFYFVKFLILFNTELKGPEILSRFYRSFPTFVRDYRMIAMFPIKSILTTFDNFLTFF